MKIQKEILSAIIFVLVTIYSLVRLPLYSVIQNIALILVVVLLISETKNSLFWEKRKYIISIFSVYVKMLFYVALIFATQKYKGSYFVALLAIIFGIIYFVYVSIKEQNKNESIISFLYINIGSFILSIVFLHNS